MSRHSFTLKVYQGQGRGMLIFQDEITAIVDMGSCRKIWFKNGQSLDVTESIKEIDKHIR